jgi:hypothetical protein
VEREQQETAEQARSSPQAGGRAEDATLSNRRIVSLPGGLGRHGGSGKEMEATPVVDRKGPPAGRRRPAVWNTAFRRSETRVLRRSAALQDENGQRPNVAVGRSRTYAGLDAGVLIGQVGIAVADLVAGSLGWTPITKYRDGDGT